MSQSDSREGAIVLTQDQQTVALREIAQFSHGLAVLADELKKGRPLQPELTRNILYVAEAGLVSISQLTGIEIESAARREERYALLRKANARVTELEQLLGSGMSTEQTQMSVQRLLKRARHWWRVHGLGHMSEIRLIEHGEVEMKLSCHLFGNFRAINTVTPVSDKSRKEQWLDSIREKGFVLNNDENDQDGIVDCDASRQALVRLVTTAMPSAQVYSISNHAGPGGGKLLLVDAQVFVGKLSDLDALPE